MARKKSCAQRKMHTVMHEFKHGTLKSGKGGKGGRVKLRGQAIAIGMSESRKRCGAGSVSRPKKTRTSKLAQRRVQARTKK